MVGDTLLGEVGWLLAKSVVRSAPDSLDLESTAIRIPSPSITVTRYHRYIQLSIGLFFAGKGYISEILATFSDGTAVPMDGSDYGRQIPHRSVSPVVKCEISQAIASSWSQSGAV